MGKKFPPKGYNQMEYPLPHNFNYDFGLAVENVLKASTIIPIIKCSESINAADTIEVNPSHANFAEETGSVIQPDSIIPKINIHMNAQMKKSLHITSAVKFIKFNWMPIYFAFEDMYTAVDNKTDTEVEDILPMVRSAGTKSANALYNNNKLLLEEDYPISTINTTETFTTKGMDTDLKGEAVTFTEETMWDALSFFSNSSMLSKAMGTWHTEYLTHEKPWVFNSSNFTHPTVKRGNPFTYCGILFHVPSIGTIDQFHQVLDTDAAADTINFKIKIRYDEWNNQFDQTTF